MRRGNDIFQSVRTEGAILPAELLQRIVDGNRDVPGLRPEDYHLAKSERLNEAATRAWNRLQGAWESFKVSMDALPETDIGTTLTRERWLLILFQELGYGRLTTHKTFEIESKAYPISHLWQNTPIHLVSFRQDLDKRTPGRAGAARISPHSLVQEFLNRSQEHLWGFISNGLMLRLLRDNVSLTRQAFVEFDLQSMMDSEAYSDFFLLFLLCHQSRVEVPEGKTVEHCWLEKWYNTAAQQGVRALDQLRSGVQNAIEVLGGGFLAHQANGQLRERLRSGQLSTQDYYRQVLRQVYRLLFLFVAEDRELLFDPDSSSEALNLYTEYYSTQRLRKLASKTRGTRHPDLWRALRLVFSRLHDGCPQLALPELDSFLFSSDATADLNELDISNSDLLKAIRFLSFTVDSSARRPVNYRNLGPEELGSVYESLLEMHPEIHIEAHAFRLDVSAGSERKTTGSYYTPASLVNCLLDSALNPVIDEAIKKPNPEKALLDLKICDPACGSGHFLIAAAHRVAKRLAAVRAGEEEPAPEATRHALRDVIGHCIYGVDVNPMSVELCKISLWLEALEPGKPLAFIDHHIKCGNSLLGTTPALLEKGIPDEAYKPIEGDDKEYCKELKKQNKSERKELEDRQGSLLYPWERLGDLSVAMVNIDDMPDDTPEALQRKQASYESHVKSSGYLFGHLWADAWCAAFVWKKVRDGGLPYPVTERYFRAIERSPHAISQWMKDEISRLSQEYNFFHWHLEFPDVFRVPKSDEVPENEQTGWSGGFDCVLGNPPWERIKLQEQEFFASRNSDIARAPNAAARKKMISTLPEHNFALWAEWCEASREAAANKHFIRTSGRYPLCGQGDLNTYALFAEHNRAILSALGRAGFIVPTGIATDDTTKDYFVALVKAREIAHFYSFENEELIFPTVHHAFKFALLTLDGSGRSSIGDFVFFARSVGDISDSERHIFLSSTDFEEINPKTHTCPTFRSRRDAELTKYIQKKVPTFSSGGWNFVLRRMIHMADDASYFNMPRQLQDVGWELNGNIFSRHGERMLPLYEAKLIHHFDHRFSTYEGQTNAQANQGKCPELSETEHSNPFKLVYPRYWISEREVEIRLEGGWQQKWLLGWRDICGSVYHRTLITAIIPRMAIAGFHQIRLYASPEQCASMNACLSSFVVDYIARQKVGGTHLTYGIFEQLPVLSLQALTAQTFLSFTVSLLNWFVYRSIELIYTAWDMEPFAQDCSYNGPPFKWDEERRFIIRCELDAAFFHLYLGSEQELKQEGLKELIEYFPTPRHAIEYIMETFPIVKRKDEQKYGTYRTKDTILEIYDEMAEVMAKNAGAVSAGRVRTGYQSRLDPLPGPPADAQGNFISMYLWDRNNWPAHIHPPRQEWEDSILSAWFGVRQKQWNTLDDEQVFPWDGREAFVYALIPYLVQKESGRNFDFYRDAALLASRPERCETLLLQDDLRVEYRQLMEQPGEWMKFPDKHKTRPDKIRKTLLNKNLITIDSDTSHTILQNESVLPPLPNELKALLPLILKAADNLEKLQRQALSQAEAAKIDVTESDITNDLEALMVA